ncbi:BRCA1 C Terminus (BRCT) domain [Popillia japonica]|uniref:BRCA1 C Terminus (BRCT) domain n=1 Tax=Popillia japonica TaxID=7064 RepID=A0AAW1MGR3_POPJA
MDVKVSVKVSFVIPDGCTKQSECSENMHRAFEACKQNLMEVNWIKPSQTLNVSDLQKNNFIVFDKFEGDTFEKIKKTPSVIIGPWCLLTCLAEGRPIPNVSWPILNMAMADCFVTCSNLPKTVKEIIKTRVQTMGGQYTDSIFQVNTHLITNSVKSEKYLKAATTGIKIMLVDWVDAIWKASLNSNVTHNDKEFEVYRCLPLQNLNICTTGFTNLEERNKLRKLIEENGGTYSGQLHVNKTDVLICKGSQISDKLKAAKKSKHVKCVTVEWITNSIEKGYALPDTDYVVVRGTSTPTKQDEFVNPNFSTISAIGNTTHMLSMPNILQETAISTSDPNETESKKRKSGSLDDLNETVDKFDLKRAKKAGTFLDGCSIYLVGFGNEQREKICKILNFSGATRYEGISDRLTHIIAGDTTCHELKLIRSKGYQIPIVTIHWLHECLEQGKMVPEEKYLVTNSATDCGSPLSKKGLQLLRNTTASSVNVNLFPENQTTTEDETNINTEIMMQYLQPTVTSEDTLAQLLKDGFDTKNVTKQTTVPEQTITQANESESRQEGSQEDATQLNPIFQNLKFIILNFNDAEELELRDCIEALSGQIVPKTYKGIPDYALVPAFNTEIKYTACEIVTDYWLTECWKENQLRPIEYYHKPFTVMRNDVLKECVVTISGYTGTERAFLNNLVEELGGRFQEQFSRVSKNGILSSSHLLSPAASGSKYNAALKWGRPVITKEWLFECARLGKFVPELNFLVGDSKAPERLNETLSTTNSIPSGNQGNLNSTEKSQNYNLTEKYENRSTATVADSKRDSKLDIQGEETETILSVNSAASPAVRHEKLSETITNTINLNKTPTTTRNYNVHNNAGTTPKDRIMVNDYSPNVCSQVTPVNKIMKQVRSQFMLGTPSDTPPLPPRWGDVNTPETPLGACLKSQPSPHLRKEMLKWINTFPDTKSRRDSTPLSELKKKAWNKICPPRYSQLSQLNLNASMSENVDSNIEANTSRVTETVELNSSKKETSPETPQNIMIQSKLQQLQEMLSTNSSTRKSTRKLETVIVTEELKSSQACTVGWDYAECHMDTPRDKAVPHFMLSGISMEEREELVKQLQSLHVTVSDLSNYDPASTHLISNRPSRNEKMLSSMAGGKWILHPDFVKKSLEVGRLVDEEEYEYGNPKFCKDIKIPTDRETEIRCNAIHFWRKEITKRGYGAFHDLRAIIVSNKRESIIKVIEAGGGMVVEANPPFTQEIYATHCLLDPKFVSNLADYIPLAEQGIYIFNTFYINDFLHRIAKDVKDCILPAFQKYYD